MRVLVYIGYQNLPELCLLLTFANRCDRTPFRLSRNRCDRTLPKDLPIKWDLADKMPETLTVDKVKELIAPVPNLKTDLVGVTLKIVRKSVTSFEVPN